MKLTRNPLSASVGCTGVLPEFYRNGGGTGRANWD